MIYNKQQLISINSSYHSEHVVTDADVEKANKLSASIEESRSDFMPVEGDRVIYTDAYGKTYEWALFAGKSMYGDDSYSLCENAYTPFVYIAKDGSIRTNASGGAWPRISHEDLKNFKFVKKDRATFCDFGHCGWTANGAFNFQAVINVWELKRNS
jgi:hypothetical protein